MIKLKNLYKLQMIYNDSFNYTILTTVLCNQNLKMRSEVGPNLNQNFKKSVSIYEMCTRFIKKEISSIEFDEIFRNDFVEISATNSPVTLGNARYRNRAIYRANCGISAVVHTCAQSYSHV